jgi:hypothetical protein
MAFNRLRDISARMESKWTSGDFIFGYEDDINENHNIDYPLLLVIPPNSTLPATEKDPINAHVKEEYDFEVIFAKPYRTSTTNTGANDTNANLDVIYSLLEAEAYNWLQAFLDSYSKKEVTLVPTPITMERETNQHNDRVVQIRMQFTVDCYSHAFAAFDDQFIRDLSPLIWLRSDVGVKTQYFGGKEVVKEWKDQSGNGHDFIQSTSAKQPEYKYQMSDSVNTENRYPFLDFDGTDDFLQCKNTVLSGVNGLNVNNTIFFISKHNDADSGTGAIVSLYRGSTSNNFTIFGRRVGENDVRISSIHTDLNSSGGDVIENTASDSADSTTIAVRALHFQNHTSKFYINGTMTSSATNSDYDNTTTYDRSQPILIGVEGSASSPDHTVLNGSIQEIMIFNSSLSEEAIVKVSNYLNHKYNIY